MSDALPFVDRHCVEVAARPAEVWRAIGRVMSGSFGGRAAEAYGRVVGCDDVVVDGLPLSVGSTVVGFHVVAADEERHVVFEGRHRFSRYRLTFELSAGQLCGTTHAVFPGPHGLLYRTAVIRTRFHVVAMRRLLASIRSAAGSPASG